MNSSPWVFHIYSLLVCIFKKMGKFTFFNDRYYDLNTRTYYYSVVIIGFKTINYENFIYEWIYKKLTESK